LRRAVDGDDGVVSVVGDSSKKISYAEMIGGGYSIRRSAGTTIWQSLR